MRVQTGFVWLTIEFSGGIVWTRWTLKFYKRWTSLPSERLVASQGGVWSRNFKPLKLLLIQICCRKAGHAGTEGFEKACARVCCSLWLRWNEVRKNKTYFGISLCKSTVLSLIEIGPLVWTYGRSKHWEKDLFICRLFNNAVSGWDYIESDDTMIDEEWIGKDVEGRCRDPILDHEKPQSA
jgi:hypothetical protein